MRNKTLRETQMDIFWVTIPGLYVFFFLLTSFQSNQMSQGSECQKR